MLKKTIQIVLLVCLTLTTVSTATTYYVDGTDGYNMCNGLYATVGSGLDGPKATIMATINLALNGDTIIVAEGTYDECIDTGNKSITITSTDPYDPEVVAATIINGDQDIATVILGEDSELIGLTIENGVTSTTNAGVVCQTEDSYPYIKKCVINGVDYGIAAYDCAPTVECCEISDIGYAGIELDECLGGIVISNIICDSTYAYGISAYNSGTSFLWNNTIVGCDDGITNLYTTLSIKNCILWDNNDDLSNCNASFSCIEDGDAGFGNISSNPCLDSSYHLNSNSPCIDEGGSSTGDEDIDGEDRVMGDYVDMGADEYTQE